VDDAAKLVATAPQYWDGEKLLGLAIAQQYGFSKPAWDVYLWYPAGVTWPAKPAKMIAQAGGVVIAAPGTLPPAADQSGLPSFLQGKAIVVGAQSDLEVLLARAGHE